MTDKGSLLHYPVLRQKLIDAQSKLDSEVALLKRLHKFLTGALRWERSTENIASGIAEAVVDVFELEFAICWRLDTEGWPAGLPGVLGITEPPMRMLNAGRYLAARYRGHEGSFGIDEEDLHRLDGVLPAEHCMVSVCHAADGTPNALLLGGNKREGFFSELTPAAEEAFGVFAAQVGAILANHQDRLQIDILNSDLLAVLRAIPDPMFELDGQGRYINVWPQDERLLVRSSAALQGAYIDDVLPVDAVETIRAGFREADETGHSFGRHICLELGVGTRWFELSISPKQSQSALPHYILLSRDITDRKEKERELTEKEQLISEQASFDSLTKLPNRLLMLNRLEYLVNSARFDERRLGVMFIDLDDFKKVNDSLGHDIGDELLIEATRRIQSLLRVDDMAGRLGGDEFIILLESGDARELASVAAETYLKAFQLPFRIQERDVFLTASVGLSIFPDDGRNSGDLLRKADVAMYHAKSLGKNTYAFYTDTLTEGVERRLLVEEQLHGALEKNELEVYYQPKVALPGGEIAGVEALLRWKSATLGNVTPDEFIPIAEQSGQILEIGRFVLSEATRAIARWRAYSGCALSVAVNISPRQFRDNHLVTYVREALALHQVPAQSLELEITEGIFMDGDEHQLDYIVEELKGTGVKLVMDDFGTGYSSLSYLRTYPFDVIKIDKSFVGDIESDAGDRELVSAAIAMGHGLNMAVVAEGVEDAAQLQLLSQWGCDFAQGYFFSRPVPEGDVEGLLDSREGAD